MGIANPVAPIITAVAGPLQMLLMFLIIIGCAIGFTHAMHEGRGQESAGVLAGKWLAFLILGCATVYVLFTLILPSITG